MSKITVDALDFSRIHFRQFYDSDFFPKPLEFDALWHNWSEVVDDLTAEEISTYSVHAPRAYASPKPNGTLRIVDQLDPINSLI